MKTTMQIIHEKYLFDKYIFGNAHEVLKLGLLIEVSNRRGPDFEEVNDVIQ